MRRFLPGLLMSLGLLSAGPVDPTSLATSPDGCQAVPAEGYVASFAIGSVVLAVFDDYSALGFGPEAEVLGTVAMPGFDGELGDSRAAFANAGAEGPAAGGEGGQVIRTSWIDANGESHEVETKINGTNVELYVQRHDKLVQAMKRYYPVKE